MHVELSDVVQRFGDRAVLRGVSLEVRAPASVALMGPSGSGKSTLLAIMAGLLRPTSGRREAHGSNGSGDLSCAWVFQASQLLTHRTVLENVALGPCSVGVPLGDARGRAGAALDRVGIGDLAGAKAYRLSGGERQRVAVARAIATEADLVLADEPTASLDAANRELVCDALVAAEENGCAVLVATHDPVVADRCSSLVRLVDGIIRTDG